MVEALKTITEPLSSLLTHVAAQATPRQLRLFAVACCRLVQDRLTNVASRAAIKVAERFADGLATVADLDAVRRPAYQVRDASGLAKLAADIAKRDALGAAQMAVHILGYAVRGDRTRQLLALLDLFGNTPFRGMPRPGERSYTMSRDCDIHGNDFRSVLFAPEWRSATVRGVASAIYANRDFSGMPVLADALEDSGCDHPGVLEHCRSCAVHYRGCWVIDGVLALTETGGTAAPRARQDVCS